MGKILALETTETFGSVAAWNDSELLGEIVPTCRSAQSLAPSISTLLNQVGWKPSELDAIAVVLGPGSFTGIRVGIATAKMIAYATGAKLIGINTLHALAASVIDQVSPGGVISAAVDAQRGDVVYQHFQLQTPASLPVPLDTSRLVSLSEWFDSTDRTKTLFTGPVLQGIESQIPVGIRLSNQVFWKLKASQLGRIISARWNSSDYDDYHTIVPLYSRSSAAEEKIILSEK